MSKEVAKKESGELSQYKDALMDETPVAQKDLVIPRFWLMQGQSIFVGEERAKTGEVRGSLDCNLIAGKGEEVECILFGAHKTWSFRDKQGRKIQPDEPLSASNATKYGFGEEVLNDEGTLGKVFECINYYVIPVSDLESSHAIPYYLSLRSSSGYQTGKKLESYRSRLNATGKPLAFKTFNLGAILTEKNGNKFFSWTATPGRDSTDQELSQVAPWAALVKQGAIKVSEEDEVENDGQPVAEKNITPSEEEF